MCGGVSRTGRFLFNVSLFLQHGNWQIFNTTTNRFSYQTHLTSTPNVSLLGQELGPRKAGGGIFVERSAERSLELLVAFIPLNL